MRKFRVNVNGTNYDVAVEEISGSQASAAAVPAPAAPSAPAAPAAKADGETVVSPMPGTILSVDISVGDAVKSGQTLMILEAMKMENEIMAPCDGRVKSVNVTKGAAVTTGDVLVVIG